MADCENLSRLVRKAHEGERNVKDIIDILRCSERWMHSGLKRENAQTVFKCLTELLPQALPILITHKPALGSNECAILASLLAALMDAKCFLGLTLTEKDAMFCEFALHGNPVMLIDVLLQMITTNRRDLFLGAIFRRIRDLSSHCFKRAQDAVRLLAFAKWCATNTTTTTTNTDLFPELKIDCLLEDYISSKTVIKWVKKQNPTLFHAIVAPEYNRTEAIKALFELCNLEQLVNLLGSCESTVEAPDTRMEIEDELKQERDELSTTTNVETGNAEDVIISSSDLASAEFELTTSPVELNLEDSITSLLTDIRAKSEKALKRKKGGMPKVHTEKRCSSKSNKALKKRRRSSDDTTDRVLDSRSTKKSKISAQSQSSSTPNELDTMNGISSVSPSSVSSIHGASKNTVDETQGSDKHKHNTHKGSLLSTPPKLELTGLGNRLDSATNQSSPNDSRVLSSLDTSPLKERLSATHVIVNNSQTAPDVTLHLAHLTPPIMDQQADHPTAEIGENSSSENIQGNVTSSVTLQDTESPKATKGSALLSSSSFESKFAINSSPIVPDFTDSPAHLAAQPLVNATRFDDIRRFSNYNGASRTRNSPSRSVVRTAPGAITSPCSEVPVRMDCDSVAESRSAPNSFGEHFDISPTCKTVESDSPQFAHRPIRIPNTPKSVRKTPVKATISGDNPTVDLDVFETTSVSLLDALPVANLKQSPTFNVPLSEVDVVTGSPTRSSIKVTGSSPIALLELSSSTSSTPNKSFRSVTNESSELAAPSVPTQSPVQELPCTDRKAKSPRYHEESQAIHLSPSNPQSSPVKRSIPKSKSPGKRLSPKDDNKFTDEYGKKSPIRTTRSNSSKKPKSPGTTDGQPSGDPEVLSIDDAFNSTVLVKQDLGLAGQEGSNTSHSQQIAADTENSVHFALTDNLTEQSKVKLPSNQPLTPTESKTPPSAKHSGSTHKSGASMKTQPQMELFNSSIPTESSEANCMNTVLSMNSPDQKDLDANVPDIQSSENTSFSQSEQSFEVIKPARFKSRMKKTPMKRNINHSVSETSDDAVTSPSKPDKSRKVSGPNTHDAVSVWRRQSVDSDQKNTQQMLSNPSDHPGATQKSPTISQNNSPDSKSVKVPKRSPPSEVQSPSLRTRTRSSISDNTCHVQSDDTPGDNFTEPASMPCSDEGVSKTIDIVKVTVTPDKSWNPGEPSTSSSRKSTKRVSTRGSKTPTGSNTTTPQKGEGEKVKVSREPYSLRKRNSIK